MFENSSLLLCISLIILFIWDIYRMYLKHVETMATLIPQSIQKQIKEVPPVIRVQIEEPIKVNPYSPEVFHDYVTFFPRYEGATVFNTERNRKQNRKGPNARAYATWLVEEDLLLRFLHTELQWTPSKIAHYLKRSERGVTERMKTLRLW